jgi:hypothetical protein
MGSRSGSGKEGGEEMKKQILWGVALTVAAFVAGRVSVAQPKPRVFELRTYTAAEGKLGDLNARFQNHTVKLFAKHGMTNVWYGVPSDAPKSTNTLIYLLAHESRESAAASWKAFREDPEWVKARAASEVNGRLTEKVESVFLDATPYSPMR